MNWTAFFGTWIGFIAGAAFARWWLLRHYAALAKAGVLHGDDARRFELAMERNNQAARVARLNKALGPSENSGS